MYALLGIGAWVAVFESGIDPVVVGLVMGLLTFAYPAARPDLERASDLFRRFRDQPTPELTRSASVGVSAAISPNERLQQLYHPWTSYVIVPLFALANAGITTNGSFLARAYTSPITLGILIGYVAGKPIGITGGSWLLTRLSGGRLRPPVGWAAVTGVGTIAGIGFTVSILIATLTRGADAQADAVVAVGERQHEAGERDVPAADERRLTGWQAQADYRCREQQANGDIEVIAVQGCAQGRGAAAAGGQVDGGDRVGQARHGGQHQAADHDLRYRETVPQRGRGPLHRRAGHDHHQQRQRRHDDILPSSPLRPDGVFKFGLFLGYGRPQPGDPRPGKPEAGKAALGRTQHHRVHRHRRQREHQARDRGEEAEYYGQAHAGHAHGDRPAEDDHLAVQPDAAGDHGAQAQQSGQVEHIRADDDPGAQALLMAGTGLARSLITGSTVRRWPARSAETTLRGRGPELVRGSRAEPE